MQNTKKPTIIGIAGGTSSGKTTIANRLYDEAIKTGTVALIKIDDYYHNKDKVQRTETGKANYDHPDSYDTDYLIKQLNELKLAKQYLLRNPQLHQCLNDNLYILADMD